MANWNETCSQAPCNKPTTEYPGVCPRCKSTGVGTQGDCPAGNLWWAFEEFKRAKDKKEAQEMLAKDESYGGLQVTMPKQVGQTKLPGPYRDDPDYIVGSFDKNTSGSLKQLRWAIYELIDENKGYIPEHVGRLTLKSLIEDLFKKYTDS